MKFIYYAIFGESWGSGHISRALNFRRNRGNDKVDIIVEFEDDKDREVINNYFPYQNTNKVNDEDYVLINDTLGKFDLKGNYKDVWVLDSLYDGINENYNYFHMLYPNDKSIEFPFIEDLLPKKKKSVMVVQGGGDDYKQIPHILEKIPKDIYCWVCVGANCRYLPELQDLVNKRDNSNLAINVPILQILDSVEYVITAAGNTLVEVIANKNGQEIAIYTKEEKEMLTAQGFSKHPSVVKVFPLDDDFMWMWND
ncbi:conserved hypothetical protein [Vibrio chagasii]|nr:conserved hypothetical protein [Vibrio chagasii]CAH7155447.1 conserved hypothetical protein [Vibrio chagasii]CAH7210826.1 conserved hypothetical protein [Vibrio chagasii]